MPMTYLPTYLPTYHDAQLQVEGHRDDGIIMTKQDM